MQVCFLESFAQPDAAEQQLSQRQGRSKFDQLRPSRVVIAGDEDALETVRTVHSPKSLQSPSRFAASPVSSPKAVSSPHVAKRRGSFALSACAPQELSEAQVENDQPHGWEEVWTKKLLASGWTGKADVALAMLGVMYVFLGNICDGSHAPTLMVCEWPQQHGYYPCNRRYGFGFKPIRTFACACDCGKRIRSCCCSVRCTPP